MDQDKQQIKYKLLENKDENKDKDKDESNESNENITFSSHQMFIRR